MGHMKRYALASAQRHLCEVDSTMAELMRLVGRTKVRSEAGGTVFQSLMRAIVYQMISTRAAMVIHQRLLTACDDDLNPTAVLELGEQGVRDVGFSRAKVASALDLSERMLNGSIPTDQKLRRLDDQQIIELLTAVKGIGQWSVEMLLIFNLRRPDVFPVTDLGVRRGHMLAWGLDEMLKPAALRRAGEHWQPYRSVASWYLWRANDCVDWQTRQHKPNAPIKY